ncbi:unnamed protein product [Ectocarpus sp. CCAP 1310/34]|nr:unnamed protein product [Ectocarpus sp. CCAP 1310/34]
MCSPRRRRSGRLGCGQLRLERAFSPVEAGETAGPQALVAGAAASEAIPAARGATTGSHVFPAAAIGVVTATVATEGGLWATARHEPTRQTAIRQQRLM